MPVNDFRGIPTGDMPGDSVQIDQGHVDKAEVILPTLTRMLSPLLEHDPHRAVVAVHGGSGVGKSEIGSVLGELLRRDGIGCYVMSGDNYPRRIPAANDAERLRRFRMAGVRGLADAGLTTVDIRGDLTMLQQSAADADPVAVEAYPWLATYQAAGRAALEAYLGSAEEVDFGEVNDIIAAFKSGAELLTLKRMGRTEGDVWYEPVDVHDVGVLLIEWTHGNNPLIKGIDIPILLNSTPEETLAHRRSRARDGAPDSPFTMMVLGLEQAKLHSQAPTARIIVSKSGELLSHAQYRAAMTASSEQNARPMLNLYPDSLGGHVHDVVDFLDRPELSEVFGSVYLLPSVFNTDLDRGFSVIDYELSTRYATQGDIDALTRSVDLKLDFILNHASVLSPQFQDLLAKGDESQYADFFIDWNTFWDGHGTMTEAGYLRPDPELTKDMFFRKPGLPLLMVPMPDGTRKPYWNTFYQQVSYPTPDVQDLMRACGLQYGLASLALERVNRALAADGSPADADLGELPSAQRAAVVDYFESRRHFLGQMDLNINSAKVWEFYADTLTTLAGYGAQIVRLDAFAYASKKPGARNFLNDPDTWELLAKVRKLADERGVKLLPEIHSRYEERIHEEISARGYLTYDFFLPGLLIHSLATRDTGVLKRWIGELVDKDIRTINMLGCHDGIPLLDLKGLLSDDEIQQLIGLVTSRGGHVKDLHGDTTIYYQVNATYYSALGEDDDAMVLARAIQMFVPGKPQVWYLDLFAGRNDHAAVTAAGEGGHKEINRTNLSVADIEAGLATPVVQRQLELLRLRSTHPAFGFDAEISVADTPNDELEITWSRGDSWARLRADLNSKEFGIETS
ncbi:sucrose phosphorylase [Propionibacterium sp. oral taxon 192 str. F0372]|uniref:sucrose phosphorylase n=1 Tax=Propionibacterium sp. oral taxon 192 TaxID=671222 RepID=UPI000352CD7B|nr:sucrose phosphorylase [Propionibacterium sp. oral taxon 192]EPH06773.1 sucrose phosphorylase [Propionibacterium sp. oral taxon 192 str. F0372]